MFTIRTKKPGAGNKCYIRKNEGGWSACIYGKPTDKECNVLANCVGYAIGRASEVYNELMGTTGNKFNALNSNAENFIERAKEMGLEIGMKPRPGAIACWAKGKVGVSSDGAGHVEHVEKVNSDGSIYNSSSAYNGSAFFNVTRNNSNGRWGMGSAYTFRAFIYNPAVSKLPDITPTVERDIYKDQLETKMVMNVRNKAGLSGAVLGTVKVGSIFNRFETVEADGYTWYKIADEQFIAQDKEEKYLIIYNAEVKPKPVRKYSEGDVVSFTGTLYADVQGNGAGQSRENLKATIGIVYEDECLKPYNINNGLGWVAEEDLTPWVEPEPPKPEELKEGDIVEIVGPYASNSIATSAPNTAAMGWTRTILKIWRNGEGKLRNYPYQVGNNSGTTGFFKAESLQKK